MVSSLDGLEATSSKARELADRIQEWWDDPKGWCYVACEAIYYLVGGKAAGLTPVQAKISVKGQEVSHWWLRLPDGSILDPTADQFDFPFPYEKGRGRGFHINMKSDTKELIEWLQSE